MKPRALLASLILVLCVAGLSDGNRALDEKVREVDAATKHDVREKARAASRVIRIDDLSGTDSNDVITFPCDGVTVQFPDGTWIKMAAHSFHESRPLFGPLGYFLTWREVGNFDFLYIVDNEGHSNFYGFHICGDIEILKSKLTSPRDVMGWFDFLEARDHQLHRR